MAKKIKRKKRYFTIPDHLVSLAAAVATAICCFWRVGLAGLYQDAGGAYYGVALEWFCLLFLPVGAPLFGIVSSMVAARLEKGTVKGARMVVQTAMLFGAAGSLFLCLAVFLCCDFLMDKLMGLPLAGLALKGFLPALVPLCIALAFAGGMDGLGNEKSVGTLRLVFCLVLFFAGPVIVSPLCRYGQQVGALLQNDQFGPAYGAMGGAFAFLAAAVVLMFFSVFLWLKQRRVLTNMERGEAFVYERQDQVFFVLVKRILPVMLPVLLLAGKLIAENLLFFRLANEEMETDRIRLWGLYAGQARTLLEVPLIGAVFFALHMLPELKTGSLVRNPKRAKEKCMVLLRCMALIMVPATVYLAVLAGPLTETFFPAGDASVIVSVLRIGSVSVILFGLALALAVFLAAGQKYAAVIACVLACTAVQLLSLAGLLKVPGMGIYAVVCANLIYAVLLFGVFCFVVQKTVRVRINWIRVFLAPCVGGIVLAAVCALFGLAILKKAPGAINLSVCALAGFGAYFIVVVLLKGATRRELSSFKGGEQLIVLARLLRLM